jgi:hypothetical protein
MQNRTLRNALRKRNYELPSVSSDMQSSETLRNSLGLNYETAALPAELRRHERRKHCIHRRWIQARHAYRRDATTAAARRSRQFRGARCVQESC